MHSFVASIFEDSFIAIILGYSFVTIILSILSFQLFFRIPSKNKPDDYEKGISLLQLFCDIPFLTTDCFCGKQVLP